ncbi:CGR1 family protein [Aspergillus mulundensis]|uniref:rRNA-processing protein n=1 Tax=Aspergillus mulundensis TaxID=1810919 RepID=A0A3D8QR39_9EURO|nr:rRNA-processing protein [Aspergillus mulundensis]RDW64286.1 rRNA-processing protein [Aspergillus mulundensis]
MSSDALASAATVAKSIRKNGKNWHDNKKPFRPNGGLTSYAKRVEARKQQAAIKEHEKELRDEREADRQAHIQRIKERRAAKEEKERYEKMAEKMHRKRVERLKRREKRNKLLSS